MAQEFRRIVVARTDRIGDVVLALPVFASLRNCFPKSRLIALVRSYTSDVVSSFPPVDEVMIYDPAETIGSTRDKLKHVDADAILLLYPRFKLAAAAFLAEIPVRVGTGYRWYSFLFNQKVQEHRKYSTRSEADYNLDLAAAIGCSERIMDIRLRVDESALKKVRDILAASGISRYFVVHPGSGGSASEWSGDKFRDLVRSITETHQAQVIVTGLENESERCNKLCAGLPRAVSMAGRFSLTGFIALLSGAELFISNSTGPIHLAAAVGIPVVGIYPNASPMTPVRWAPLTERKRILTPKDGSDNMSVVTVEEVADSIQELISAGSR